MAAKTAKPTKKGKDQKQEKKAKLTPAQIRFAYLYLGAEGGECWNSATMAYLRAFYPEGTETKEQRGRDWVYTSAYKVANTEGPKLLVKPGIKAFVDELLTTAGYSPDVIKRRYAQLAMQDKNLPIALQATDRVAKIAGVVRDEGLKVNVPELEAVAEAIKGALGSFKPA